MQYQRLIQPGQRIKSALFQQNVTGKLSLVDIIRKTAPDLLSSLQLLAAQYLKTMVNLKLNL